MIPAQQALERLQEGNLRFVSHVETRDTITSQRHRDLTAGQEPFAIILGCSDSRVPAELVFDQGLGDLFVIRVAGNIVAPSQIGSVEFAAERFGTSDQVVYLLDRSRRNPVASYSRWNATLDYPQRSRRTEASRMGPQVPKNSAGILKGHWRKCIMKRRRRTGADRCPVQCFQPEQY